MLPRWFAMLPTVLMLLLVPVSARADEAAKPPTVKVRVRSLDIVIEQVKMVIALAGREEMGRQIEGLIRTKIGAKGLEGIDPGRPFGAYARLARELDEVAAVALVPIADPNALLSLLENLGLKVRKGPNGLYTVNTGTPIEVYFRFAHKYLYATGLNPANIDEANLIKPEQIFAGQLPALSASLRLDQIPEAARQIALAQIEQKLSEAQDKKAPGETPAQHAFKVQVAKEILNQIGAILNEGAELELGLELDQKTQQLAVTGSLQARKGTKLATAIAAVGQNQSRVAGLMNKAAAANGLLHLTLPKNLHDAFNAVVDETMTKALDRISEENKRKQAERLWQALAPTIRAGEIDGAFSLSSTAPGQNHTLVVALKLRQGDKLAATVEQLVESMLKDIPPAQAAKIKLNAETAGKVKIHRLDFQEFFDKKAKEVFGANPIFVAFRDDALFVALGDKGLEQLKEALAAPSERTEYLILEVSLARLSSLLGKTDEQKAVLRKLFAQGDDGLVRLTVAGGPNLQLQVSTRLSVVQFFRDFTARFRGQK